MAAISVFSPSIDEKRWVSQGSKTLDSEHIIEIKSIPTIFQVPKATNETKPEAYTPQLLGLGPYHHLRPELYNADRQKLYEVKKFLKQNSSKKLPQNFIHKMRDLEPMVRANYDKYLDLEGSTLDYIIAVDSLYLLDFLGSYDDKTDSENLEPGRLELAKDIVMLENQIPAFSLVEMWKELALFSPETMLCSRLSYNFCKTHSPLELAEQWEIRHSESKHVLDHMYHLIVSHHNRDLCGDNLLLLLPGGASRSEFAKKGTECLTLLRELGLGGAIVNPLLFAFKSLQIWEDSKFADMVIAKNKEQKPKIQKIEIPSASELYEKHKVMFVPFQREGIRNIGIVEEHQFRALFLPTITLKCDSEVVLRNLVAYEAAVKSTFELGEYVDLMCGIVHTPKDVALLRKKGIIKGSLNDERVAEMFNGIMRCVEKSKEESTSQKAVKQVEKMVKEWENRKWYKRQYRFVKKIFKIGVQFVRKPFGIAMKYVLYMFMVLQAYCQVYGCNIGGSQANAVSLMMPA